MIEGRFDASAIGITDFYLPRLITFMHDDDDEESLIKAGDTSTYRATA